MENPIHYPCGEAPAPGETREVGPGVFWIRMSLPFALDHINLWLLEDGDGWCAVDTGISCDETRAAWERIAGTRFGGRPLRRLIVTHFHPDHVGLAGWMTERFGAELWMPFTEWAMAQTLSRATGESVLESYRRFYRAAGFDADHMGLIENRSGHYARLVAPVPFAVRRIRDGEILIIGGRAWRVIVAGGHSVEHASLYCEEAGLLIAGDQILPQITPNVSVAPTEPEADPLNHFLAGLEKFQGLGADTLVLPGHRRPFVGLAHRLEELAHHHDERLQLAEDSCARPSTAFDVSRHLFDRKLDTHQVFFAIGESIAHLHYLVGRGRVVRELSGDGVYRFARAG